LQRRQSKGGELRRRLGCSRAGRSGQRRWTVRGQSAQVSDHGNAGGGVWAIATPAWVDRSEQRRRRRRLGFSVELGRARAVGLDGRDGQRTGAGGAG
jgi:hypothetical protein